MDKLAHESLRFSVSPTTVSETNLLLRALWAEIRKEFGKLAWQFNPACHAKDQTIYFGWADIGFDFTVRIGIVYKQRGVAKQILFEGATGQEGRIRKCLRAAQKAMQKPEKFSGFSDFGIKSDSEISEISGERVRLKSMGKGVVRVFISGIEAFDERDAHAEFERRLRLVVDSLSFLINFAFARVEIGDSHDSDQSSALVEPHLQGLPDVQPEESTLGEIQGRESPDASKAPGISTNEDSPDEANIKISLSGSVEAEPQGELRLLDQEVKESNPKDFLDQPWLEGHPFAAGTLVIESVGMNLLDALAGNSLDTKLKMLADAAHHFHNGMELDTASALLTSAAEKVLVFYVSSLETASLIGAAEVHRCSKCGQPEYAISERVKEFVKGKLGEPAARFIKNLYGSRSNYLHQGILLSSQSYTGSVIPQLDPSSENGVLAPMALVNLPQLREFTSYCLRALVAEWFATKA